MRKYTVSCDIILPVVVEIEAEDADEALDKLHDMDRKKLLRYANVEEAGILIAEGSEDIEDVGEA